MALNNTGTCNCVLVYVGRFVVTDLCQVPWRMELPSVERVLAPVQISRATEEQIMTDSPPDLSISALVLNSLGLRKYE